MTIMVWWASYCDVGAILIVTIADGWLLAIMTEMVTWREDYGLLTENDWRENTADKKNTEYIIIVTPITAAATMNDNIMA